MKEVLVLLLLWVSRDCCGSKIVKRFVNDQNTTSDDSFQVNVSAGYGVSENSTLTTPQTFEIQERAVTEEKKTTVPVLQDQISQPSQMVNEILPSPSYQVHEKTGEVQEKKFQVKNHRYRSVEKRVRPKIVKDQEHKESRIQPASAGTKIVEVLRVPAIYELHLQSDPHRLVSLNPLVNKLNSMGNQKYQYKRHYYTYNNNSGKNLLPQQSQVYNNYAPPSRPQTVIGNVLHNFKNRLVHPRPNLQTYNQVKPQSYNQAKPQVYKQPVRIQKPEILTPAPIISKEIPADYYQKPQALHEVPAPVLNRQPQKPVLPTPVATSVPNLVYGKTVDNPYHPTQPTPRPWNQYQEAQNQYQGTQNQYQGAQNQYQGAQNQYQGAQNQYQEAQNQGYDQSYQNNKGQVDTVPNYYQQYYQNQGYHQSQDQQYYQSSGTNNQQNTYSGNEAIADYLDQSLVNVNGEVATYLNEDGIMTVSNFHHHPKLYQPPMEYEMPVKEEVGSQFNGLMSSYQNQDLTNYDNPMLSNGYSQEIPVNEVVSEPAVPQHQSFTSLLDSAKASLEENRFEPMYTKRMSPKPFSRRMEPLDYILYIKERTLD